MPARCRRPDHRRRRCRSRSPRSADRRARAGCSGPRRRAPKRDLPCRRIEGGLPHRGRGVGVDRVTEVGDRLSGLAVVTGERRASPEALLAGLRSTGRVDAVESSEELATSRANAARSVGGLTLQSRRRAIGRPTRHAGTRRRSARPWRPVAGSAAELRRQDRQPPVLLLDAEHVPLVTRQPHEQLVTEPEARVVVAVDVDGTHR